jgi:hypothetical protein
MKTSSADVADKPVNRKREKLLWLTALGIVVVFIFLYVIPTPIFGGVFGILMLLLCIDAVFIALNSRKFYNWALAFIAIIIIAFYFRRMRWPVTGILYFLGFAGLALFSLFSARILLRRFRHNTFLRYIGFAASTILSIVCVGILFKTMHWPLGTLVISSGLVLFIPFLFAFVFTLPSSNYISWNSTERTVFFRAIVIPMTFIYVLCVMMLVLPELWTSITRTQLKPFYMYDLELFSMPGLL